MKFNPTHFYFEPMPASFVIGLGWFNFKDNVDWPTWNVMIYLGTFAIRIEKGYERDLA